MSLKKFEITSLAQLRQWIQDHLKVFSQGSLILLQGKLGSGKTTFVTEVVRALGGDPDQVSSPTFALHQVYDCPDFQVDHMDLYRLPSEEDLASSGFFEMVENSENLSFVEWAERIDTEFYENIRAQVYVIALEVKDFQRFLSCLQLGSGV